MYQPMTTKINPIFQRRGISTEEAAKETADAFGASLPWVRSILEIIHEEVTV